MPVVNTMLLSGESRDLGRGVGMSGLLGQQTTNRLTSREPARQNNFVPAGPSELRVGWRAISLPQSVRSITARQLWFGTTARRLGQMGWYRWNFPAAPDCTCASSGGGVGPRWVGGQSGHWGMSDAKPLDKHVNRAGVWTREQVFYAHWQSDEDTSRVSRLPCVCILDVYMKIDGRFHTESLSNFPQMFFFLLISKLAQCICHFFVFLFPSAVSENNKKRMASNHFWDTHTQIYPVYVLFLNWRGFLFCRHVCIFRWG